MDVHYKGRTIVLQYHPIKSPFNCGNVHAIFINPMSFSGAACCMHWFNAWLHLAAKRTIVLQSSSPTVTKTTTTTTKKHGFISGVEGLPRARSFGANQMQLKQFSSSLNRTCTAQHSNWQLTSLSYSSQAYAKVSPQLSTVRA